MSTALMPIPVAGHAPVMVAHIDGDEWVALRPFCEALGVAYPRQLTKLRERSWACVTLKVTQDSTGRPQEMVFIDRRTTLMWLAQLSESRVSENIRENVIAYQDWAAQTLDDTYTATRISRDVVPEPDDSFDLLHRMVDQLKYTHHVATEALSLGQENSTEIRQLKHIIQPIKIPAIAHPAILICGDKKIGDIPSDRQTLTNTHHWAGPCVYALHSPKHDVVKIGHASNLMKRWPQHEPGHGPMQLVLLWKLDSVNAVKQLEKELHADCFPFLTSGREWYNAGVLLKLRNLDPSESRCPTLFDEAG